MDIHHTQGTPSVIFIPGSLGRLYPKQDLQHFILTEIHAVLGPQIHLTKLVLPGLLSLLPFHCSPAP